MVRSHFSYRADEDYEERWETRRYDLSKLEGVDPSSIKMKVSGFGQVPATYDENSGVVSWTVTRRLRTVKNTVHLSLRRRGEPKSDFARWTFELDQNAYYLPEYERRISAKGAANAATTTEGDVRAAVPVE